MVAKNEKAGKKGKGEKEYGERDLQIINADKLVSEVLTASSARSRSTACTLSLVCVIVAAS